MTSMPRCFTVQSRKTGFPMGELGIECCVHTSVSRVEEWTTLTMAFVKRHFGVK